MHGFIEFRKFCACLQSSFILYYKLFEVIKMVAEWLYAADRQFILSASASIAAPGTREQESQEETLRLLFVHGGACQLSMEAGKERLAGDRMVLLRGRVHYRVEDSTQDLLLIQVDITHMPRPPEGYSLYQLYRQYPDYQRFCQAQTPFYVFHDRYSLIRFTAESLKQYTVYDEPAQRNLNLSMSLTYMMLVIASALYEKQRQPYKYNRHVRKAIEYIHDNYMHSINAEDIASYVGVHTGHLHRLFRTEIGVRVTEYLTNLRLEKAKALLKRTDIPITYIASHVGISSQQYLSRLFRQNVGMTPQAYRRSYDVTCDYGIAQKYYAISLDLDPPDGEGGI